MDGSPPRPVAYAGPADADCEAPIPPEQLDPAQTETAEPDWRARSANRRARAEEARARQKKLALLAGAAVLLLFVAVLAFAGVGLLDGVRGPAGDATSKAAGPAKTAGKGGPSGQAAQSGSAASAPATGAALLTPYSGPPPSSVAAFSPSPRLFTPSTIGNPFGDYRFIRTTKFRVYSRRAVDEVRIVVFPPAAYADAAAQGAEPVPAVIAYKGPMKKGLNWFEWWGQTNKRGYALPRGIYTARLTVDKDAAEPRDLGRSIDTTVELVSFVTIGNRDKGLVAITLDDGWNADPRLFELLERENIPATAFFIAGRGVADKHPELVRKAMDAGMEIANHSLEHAWLLRLDDDGVMRQAIGGRDILTPIAGYDRHWYRPSGGAMDARTMAALYRANHVPVQWSVDTEDTNGRRTNADRVATTMEAVKRLGSGTIILGHFGGHGTYEVLSEVIPKVRAMGLGFGTLSQVMAGTPGFTDQGPMPAMVATETPR